MASFTQIAEEIGAAAVMYSRSPGMLMQFVLQIADAPANGELRR
jgi:hypothetical protein